MGDSITIPRTFAGLIGVADVQNSVKRHYLNIPINQNDSTGVVFGGSGTTGFNFFQRNVTLEKFLITGRSNTTLAETTVVKANVFGPGTTTLFSLVLAHATTVTSSIVLGNSTGPVSAAVAAIGASTPLRVELATRQANVDRISMTLVFVERLS